LEKTKAMTEKYADQYVDELIYFPEIEKELRRMVKSLTGELSEEEVWTSGSTISKSFLKMVKLNRFIVARFTAENI
jgi:hypothetical protein